MVSKRLFLLKHLFYTRYYSCIQESMRLHWDGKYFIDVKRYVIGYHHGSVQMQ